MLLGLVAALMLAVLLQLNLQRAPRPAAYDVAPDGVIHLRAWVVAETPIQLTARPILALPAPAPAPARRPEPLRFVGEMRMLRRPPVRTPARMPPDVIVIPDDILVALMAAERIGASIWQSPPGTRPWRRPVQFPDGFPTAVALH